MFTFLHLNSSVSRDASKQQLAIKVIDLEKARDDIEEIQQEIFMLGQCRNEFITGYYRSYVRGMKLWMVMELLCGSAGDLVKHLPLS